MSKWGGRLYLFVMAVLMLTGAGWYFWLLTHGIVSEVQAGIAIAVGVAGAVGVIGGIGLTRFGDVRVTDSEIEVAPVIGLRRVIELGEVEEVIIVERLLLPGRATVGKAGRLILRRGELTLAAISPPTTTAERDLAHRSIRMSRITGRLTPWQLQRRYPGAASAMELVTWPLAAIAIVIALVAVFTSVGRLAGL